MEAKEIEKITNVTGAMFDSNRSKEVTPMTNADLPSFGLGLRKKKKESEAE